MKRRQYHSMSLILGWVLLSFFLESSNAYGTSDTQHGIQPLLELGDHSVKDYLPPMIQALLSAREMEEFLRTLEHDPPDWSQLRNPDITLQSERLFQFNRQRDTARAEQDVLLSQKPIAFLWAGILRQYFADSQGFSIALGPEQTKTSWGIVRFKPIALPDFLIAIPSPELRKDLMMRQKNGAPIEIIVVCIGTLVSNESLIYGFSHDDHEQGMIMPVVSVQELVYILKPSADPLP